MKLDVKLKSLKEKTIFTQTLINCEGSPPNFASNIKQIKQIKFYFPLNHQKTYDFLMILVETEVNPILTAQLF